MEFIRQISTKRETKRILHEQSAGSQLGHGFLQNDKDIAKFQLLIISDVLSFSTDYFIGRSEATYC